MHIESVETVQRFIEIELEWDELYKTDKSATIYLSSRFMASIVIRAAGRFRILVAWSDDKRCVGIFPLLVQTRWSKTGKCLYNELDMLGHVFDADYTGLLCDPEYEEQVCKAFAHEISGMSFGRLILSFFSGPASRLETLCGAFDPNIFETKLSERKINSGKTNNLICPYVNLPEGLLDGFSRYLDMLSANSRQKFRRLLRRFNDDPELKITRSKPETYKQDVAILSELWFLQYAERKGQKRASKLAAQLKEIISAGLANGLIYLAILWYKGKPVAAQANYVDPVKRHALFHVGARDDTISDLPIGLLLQTHCIRWSIANGLKRYDFTLGDEPYKYSFGASHREIASVEVAAKSGANISGRLDKSCQKDVAELIRRYAARGRREDARTAARQALAVWPDMSFTADVEALIAEPDRP